MKRLATRMTLLAAVLSTTVISCPHASAQSGAAGYTAGSGARTHNSGYSGQDQPLHDNRPYYAADDSYQGWGDTRQTLPTNTRRYQSMLHGAGGRLHAYAGVLAPNTVNPAPIGKESYDLGLPKVPLSPYTGPYRIGMPGPGLPTVLPTTATSSVDINTVDDNSMRSAGGTGSFGPGGPGSGSEP